MALKPQLNRIIQGDWVEVLKALPSNFVHCCITSPPFWGQRLYGWGGDGSCDPEKKIEHIWGNISSHLQQCSRCGMFAPKLGLEKTPEEHIENLVLGLREIHRVLRDDGVLWLNYGDKYASCKSRYSQHEQTIRGKACDDVFIGNKIDFYNSGEYKDGDLLMLPARVALALQADGWHLRSDIVWAKAISFGPHQCPHCGKELIIEGPDQSYLFEDEFKEKTISHKKSGTTMPESVNGWRWERHKIKVKDEPRRTAAGQLEGFRKHSGNNILGAQWRLCPGCPKCNPNDGYVLRKGAWRPTSAHEHLFLLTKTDKYYCDAEAVREEVCAATLERDKYTRILEKDGPYKIRHDHETPSNPSGRNLRNVWCINPKPYKFAHYATFPPDLVIPCIKAGTSEKGCCPKCGSPWARMIESKQLKRERPADRTDRHKAGQGINSCGNTVAGVETTTLGWRPTCKCGIEETTPCIVYDPFMGSATVAAEAARLGRNYLGSELNEEYLNEQAKYRVAEAETGVTFEEQKAGQIPLFKE